MKIVSPLSNESRGTSQERKARRGEASGPFGVRRGGLVQAMAARRRLERLPPLLPTSSFGPTCLSV